MPLDPRAIIAAGENAKIEFKRDDRNLRPERLAREIAAFANMNGGMIMLGVEDDGTVSGVTRRNLQAWLLDTVIGRFIDPQIVPTTTNSFWTASRSRSSPCQRAAQSRMRYGNKSGPTTTSASATPCSARAASRWRACSSPAGWSPWRRCRCRGVRWPTSTCAGWRTTS